MGDDGGSGHLGDIEKHIRIWEGRSLPTGPVRGSKQVERSEAALRLRQGASKASQPGPAAAAAGPPAADGGGGTSAAGSPAAIRGRRSSRGGSRPGLGSLACALPESQCGFESLDLLGTTHRARREGPAFPDLDVFLDVPEMPAAAVVPHLPMHLLVYVHEQIKWPGKGANSFGELTRKWKWNYTCAGNSFKALPIKFMPGAPSGKNGP